MVIYLRNSLSQSFSPLERLKDYRKILAIVKRELKQSTSLVWRMNIIYIRMSHMVSLLRQSLRSLSPLFRQTSPTQNSAAKLLVIHLAIILMTEDKLNCLRSLRKAQTTMMIHMQHCAQLPTPVLQMRLLQFWCSLRLDCAQNSSLNGGTKKDHHERHKNTQRNV